MLASETNKIYTIWAKNTDRINSRRRFYEQFTDGNFSEAYIPLLTPIVVG